MSKDRKKLLHIHSSVNDKQPTPATLELGELGVNNAKGNAFISTKNSDGEVVRFSEDETIIGWMEQKEVFPYEGYVRGSDNSQVGGVTEQDLLNNKSNIIIKLNQVVPENTDYSPYDEKVNGAKDIYGNLINPISEGGYKDGAGLAIDMSQYVMQGANPSFSSVTTTCGALFQGTTEIEGLDGDCGSEFNVHVDNSCIETDKIHVFGSDWTKLGISCDDNTISNESWLKGEEIWINAPQGAGTISIDSENTISAHTTHFSGYVQNDIVLTANTIDTTACSHNYNNTNDFKITECTDGSGTTTIKSCKGFNVKSGDIVLEQCGSSGQTRIKSCDLIKLESKNIILADGDCGNGEITIETNDLCLVGNEKINVYGDETNVGLDCDDEIVATNTNVYGKNILVSATTGSICEMSPNDATLYGAVKTNIGINCNDTATAATTTVKGGKVIVDASTTDLGLTSKRDIVESSERDIKITANDNICETAGNEASFYGVSVTRLGENCDGTTKTSQLELGGENICVDATDRASMYGANKSDLGINCSDNDRSTLTRVSGDTVNEGGNIVNTNAETSINETAPTISGYATTQIIEKAPQIIESASTSISETAPNITETASQNITETATGKVINTATGNVETTSVNAKITENANTNIEETAGTDINETAGNNINNTATNDIYVTAGNKLCENGKDSYFYGTNSTTIGKGCDGNLSPNITYYRNAEEHCAGFTATTVDDALHEVYDRSEVRLTWTADTASTYSKTNYTLHQDLGNCEKTTAFTVNDTIVSMSAETYPASSELLKKYTLWQYVGDTRKEIGVIDIPKDHILKDVSIVNGHLNGDTFTPCADGDVTCTWYIKLVWNVFDPSTGHADDKITYLPADDFVQDYEFQDSSAIKFTQWYDGKKNHVSADTTVRIMSNDGLSAKTFDKINAVHTLSSYTLNSVSGDVKNASSATNWTYDPFDKKVTITAATDASHINRKTVSWSYGDVKNATGNTYDPGAGTVNTMSNRTMSFVIPQSVDNINRGKLTINHGDTSEEYDPATDKTMSLTHGKLKITHNGLVDAEYDTSVSTSYTMPHSALTLTYGATSGKSGSVVYNTSASTSVTIPTSISHLNRGKFTVKHCNSEVTFDPSTNTSITMSHSTLSYTHNGFTGTYNACSGATFSSPHSSLTISYGSTCALTSTGITYDTSAGKSIVVPKTISDVTGGKITTNCTNGCTTLTGDLCVNGVVKANALYSTSDINLKENIKDISYEDYHKVSSVNLKSFNFKDDETKTKTYGVIAQDLQAVGLDNIVHKDENNNLSVDYTSLLILKIADLENTIKNLSEEIKNLKGENKK